MKFSFGNKKPDIKQYAIVGIVLTSIIAALSQCTGISELKLWDLLDEIQRKHFPGTIVNEFVIKDPEKLERRIKRDVDRAIDDYWESIGEKPAEVPRPIYSEKEPDGSKAQELLGGEMRLCAPWVPDCPKQNEKSIETTE